MFLYYLKLIFRRFVRNPIYPVISILCLTLGMASVIFVSYWVKNELNYDTFHNNFDRIYRLTIEKNDLEKGYHTHFARSWYGWLKEIGNHIPEIEKTTRFTIMTWLGNIISVDNKSFESIVLRTDSSFFDMFSLNFVAGKSENIFNEPFQVILSESAAKKYFGNQNPIGKTMLIYCTRCPEKKEHVVVAVVKDLPANSHFHFDILATYEDLENYSGWAYNYVLLSKGSDPQNITNKFYDFAKNFVNEDEVKMLTLHLQKITDIHLNSDKLREIEKNGNKKNVYLFAGIALFVFFIALFNYINLQSVNLIKNYKSLQVFKVIGAKNNHLLLFQILESSIYSAISLYFAFFFL